LSLNLENSLIFRLIALFLTAASATSGAQSTLFGGLLGLMAAVALGWALFATTIRLYPFSLAEEGCVINRSHHVDKGGCKKGYPNWDMHCMP
jgi:hypothetical protein